MTVMNFTDDRLEWINIIRFMDWEKQSLLMTSLPVTYSSTYYSNVLYCLKPYLSYMQAGGFKLPFLVVGGCIVILMLLLVVLVRPTGTYFPW